ncbi:hypothetical protein GE061_007121 [Apolygus lucorum]|uniref:Uncharacterized protein n=1 Tax=Apolygus lucorum TaxID=248454 RepID=A0A8S9WTF3_APOLU|nr:hypothetical protein GE061_007121 [Apolygus lucorum]
MECERLTRPVPRGKVWGRRGWGQAEDGSPPMNRAEEVELFRRSREVSVLRAKRPEDLVLSVLKEPLVPNHQHQESSNQPSLVSTSEDDDEQTRVNTFKLHPTVPV